MRVVIFGAAGTLGQEMVKAFSDREVFAPSSRELDISDGERLRAYLFAVRPALVINAAAYNFVDQAEMPDGYFRAFETNGLAVGRLARLVGLLGVPLVHYSTDQVFCREIRGGYSEEDRPGPAGRLSAYGRSKLLGEKLLRHAAAKFYLIRTSRLFGEPGEGVLAKKSFVNVFRERARHELYLNAVNGERASVTYARDLAYATRALWEDGAAWGIYHLVNEGPATWFELARAVVALTGEGAIVRPVSAEALPRPAFRPQFSVLLNTKRPKLRPWQEALAEYLSQRKK